MAKIHDIQHASSNIEGISGLHNNRVKIISNNFHLAYEMRHLFRAMGVVGLYHTPKGWREPNSSTLSNCLSSS